MMRGPFLVRAVFLFWRVETWDDEVVSWVVGVLGAYWIQEGISGTDKNYTLSSL
jgi:hypothetical protein